MKALWFAVTVFVGATLLFVVEPMVGKMLLPALGGAPAVWGTCLVFFQAALLAGYAWAHLVGSRVPQRWQPLVHAALLVAAIAALPVRVPEGAPPPDQAFPVLWLVGRLARTVGLQFVALAATAPLVQRWFASTRGDDPYFLYAASNAGSLAALVAYPVVVEPQLRLGVQASCWGWGVVGLAVLVAGCGATVLRRAPERASSSPSSAAAPGHEAMSGQRTRWLLLALVPSALMLAVTTFVTTDVAPVPLLWVAPLALYLAAFVIPFSPRPPIAHDRVLRALPAALLALAFTLVVGADRLLWVVVVLHFGAFFVVALACHGELARLRPAADRLTGFYLVVSAGGVIGGALVALVAPVAFPAVWEYPLSVVAACALRAGMLGGSDDAAPVDFDEIARREGFAPRRSGASAAARRLARRWGPPVAAFVSLTAAMRALAHAEDIWRLFVTAQIATATCVIAWAWRSQPRRFTWMVGAMLAAPAIAVFAPGTLFVGRSFFAVHRVIDDAGAERHLYVQGTTFHGLQSTRPEKARVAGAYFHRTGPAGDVLSRVTARRVALVGLGVASLAAYAESGQAFTFYEIDPVVARIAEDPRLFTFLRDARERGARVDVVLGDARVQLAQAPDASFDLLVLDAYSSDVVPTHLLTREAFALYFGKLAAGGLVLMNVSNRYLDLERVVGAIADADGLVARRRDDPASSSDDAVREDGKAASRWIVLARGPQGAEGGAQRQLATIAPAPAWQELHGASGRGARPAPWSDDYVNVVGCLRF
jgi:hypothetical protein